MTKTEFLALFGRHVRRAVRLDGKRLLAKQSHELLGKGEYPVYCADEMWEPWAQGGKLVQQANDCIDYYRKHKSARLDGSLRRILKEELGASWTKACKEVK
jgi:hypothetical protein